MNLSADTTTHHPTTERRRRATSARLGAYGAGIALAVAVGGLALTGPSTYGQGEGPDSAFARPTRALHGHSLAVYLAEHYDAREERSDRRTAG